MNIMSRQKIRADGSKDGGDAFFVIFAGELRLRPSRWSDVSGVRQAKVQYSP